MTSKLKLSEIKTDGGTQVRESICEDTVARYAERMTEGDAFPPLDVFHDGSDYYLADGFHRVMAAQRVGFADFACTVHKGTKSDAAWHALGANRANGQPMSKGDVRHAVERALVMWPDRTQQAIADQVGCSQRHVGRIQDELRHLSKLNVPATRKGVDGKSRPTSYAKPTRRPTTMEEEEEMYLGKDEPETDSKEKEVAKKKGKIKYVPPCNGMQFARLAILKMSEIQKDDTERVMAFKTIKEWINENE
jgi:ParB-like chromosome segregation protein Spo0J